MVTNSMTKTVDVKWNNENHGSIITRLGDRVITTTCHSREYGIKKAIFDVWNMLSACPKLLQKFNNLPTNIELSQIFDNFNNDSSNMWTFGEPDKKTLRVMNYGLSRIYPPIQITKDFVMNVYIVAVVHFMMKIKSYYLDQLDLNDKIFATLIGIKRDWKHECPLCLVDDHKTCSCGHSDSVMFRPCGHTICAPCFPNLRMMYELPKLKPATITLTGVKFLIGDKKNVNTSGGFDCPLCRTAVTSTFDVESSQFPQRFYEIQI